VASTSADESEFEIAERHMYVCQLFGEKVAAVEGNWQNQSPCTGWDARDVLEHVIGFHDVLLLRPMNAKPKRPKDDAAMRWAITEEALRSLFARPRLFDGPVDVPAIGNNPPTQVDAASLVRLLSLDVFVHSWDLARAAGHKGELDPYLCTWFLAALPKDPGSLVASGMYDPPRELPANSGAQSVLLARLGRDPDWQPSTKG